MTSMPSAALRFDVVSVGLDPLSEQWEPPWAGVPPDQRPDVVIRHFTRSPLLSSAVHERAVTPSESGSTWTVAGARLKTSLQTRGSRVSSAWLWEMKRDPVLREQLRRSDLVLSRDTPTDAALAHLGDLVQPHRVVRSDGTVSASRLSLSSALKSWSELLQRTRQLLVPPVDRAALGDLVQIWGPRVQEISQAHVPAVLAPVAQTLEALLDVQYWATGEGGDDFARHIAMPLLAGGPDWVSGSMAAMDRVIRLRRQWHELTEDDLRAVTGRALEAAQVARLRDADAVARCHALIALSVVTHRSRHPQRHTSSMVTDTHTLLDPLRGDATLRGMTDDQTPRPGAGFVGRGGSPHAQKPQVAVLPGPFGTFHTDLVAAIEPVCSVTVSDLRQHWPELRRRRPIPQDLRLLSALREGRVDLSEVTLDGQDIEDPSLQRHVRCLRRLKIELSHHDVVVSDWGDVATMWASHLRPRRTRLVTRWHGVDLFDPWLHLVDWRGVDEVLVTTSALAGLFVDLTRGTAAPPPVTIGPYLPDLARFDQPKHPDARFTLGLVGWGRLVKDPAFAVDLMERDERRRLVLIGPPFADSVDTTTRTYVERLMHRLDSAELRDRVHIVGPTDDVAGHLRSVGVILSTSLREGWHLGLVEGAASGAVPIVRDWPMLSGRGGAASVYPQQWIVTTLDDADRAVAALQDPTRWGAAAREAKREILERMAAPAAQQAYQIHVLGTASRPPSPSGPRGSHR